MPNILFDAFLKGRSDGCATLMHYPDGSSLDDQDFFALASRFAHVLVDAGIQPGDRVMVQIEKSAANFALYVAAVQAGAVFIPLNTGYTANELEYFVDNAAPILLVLDPTNVDAAQELITRTGVKVHTLAADGGGSLMDKAQGMASSFDTVARDADDLAAILYTSGTTGRSKGAMLSHKNLLSNAEVLVNYWQFTKDDVLLHALPIFHTHGLFVAGNTIMLSGSSMIWLQKFTVDAVLEQLPRATTMMGVPTFYTRLLRDARFSADKARHMRLFISGSAPMLAETHIEFEQRTGLKVLERYGMTETNMNTSNPYVGERISGSVGLPLPGVSARVMNMDTNAVCDAEEVGMLQVKGDNVFAGYWQMPEKTREEFTDDGFFITGDLATISDNGYYTIVGRGKDLIISGGYNVYPKEVELVLDDIDGVVESAVIGAPHPDFGEAVVGVLVLEEGATIDEKSVTEKISESLARFKQPKSLKVLDELPRNAMGKVQKNELRDTFGDEFSS